MKNMREFSLLIGLIGLFLITISIANLQSQVSFSPKLASVTNCDKGQIIKLWDAVFKLKWSNTTSNPAKYNGKILVESTSGKCNEFAAFIVKNGSGELYLLTNEFDDKNKGVYYLNPPTPLQRINSSSLEAYYLNSTKDVIDQVIKNFDTPRKFIDTFNDFNSWSSLYIQKRAKNLSSSSDAESEFRKYFNFSLVGKFAPLKDIYGTMKSEVSNESHAIWAQVVHKSLNYAVMSLARTYYKKITPLKQTKQIGSFKFKVDSGWNYAFNLKDHFSTTYNVSFRVVRDSNKSINVTPKISGTSVLFRPNKSFIGTNWFRVTAFRGPNKEEVVTSNLFNVTIVNETSRNNKPILNKSFDNLVLSYGSIKKYNLSQYFYDKDGDKLTFSYRKSGNLLITIVGDIMTVQLTSSTLIGNEGFKVLASDGKSVVESNWVSVKLKTVTPPNPQPPNPRPPTPIPPPQPKPPQKSILWIVLLIIGIVMVLAAIVLFLVYKRSNRSPEFPARQNLPISPRAPPSSQQPKTTTSHPPAQRIAPIRKAPETIPAVIRPQRLLRQGGQSQKIKRGL